MKKAVKCAVFGTLLMFVFFIFACNKEETRPSECNVEIVNPDGASWKDIGCAFSSFQKQQEATIDRLKKKTKN